MDAKSILCIIGALMINLSLGTFYSIGNIIPYVASYMRNNGSPEVTSEHGAWITASFLLGQGMFIMVGSFIEQRFDSRVACIFGCVIHCASTFATIWALKVNYLAVILIYGLGSGLGCGSAYIASIIAAQKWFPQSKGVVTGLIVSGFGLGGLIFTSLQTLYMNPTNIKADLSGYFDKTVYDRVPNLFMYMGIIFTLAQTVGCILAFPPPSTVNMKTQNTIENSVTIIVEEVLPNIKSFLSAFKYKIFYIIGLMMMLVAPGIIFVNSLGKRYGLSYINDDRFLATVVSVAAIANALGRLTWGFLMDRFPFSTCYTAKVLLFSSLIILFPFGFILQIKTLYFIWMLGLFFGFSGTFVLFPVFIEQVFGTKFHGMIYGLLYILLALSSITASFVIQVTIAPALRKSSNSDENFWIRAGPCVVIAALYLLSLILYIVILPTKRLEIALRRRMEEDIIKAKNTLMNRQDLFPMERGTLTEKTSNPNEGIRKENSLGSIVRFRNSLNDDNKKLKTFGKAP